MIITLRFVEGGGWDSRIIKWDTRCRFSHVEALSSNDKGMRTFGAQLDGGVRYRDLADPCYSKAIDTQSISLVVAPAQYQAFWDFLIKQAGKPYDWRAIVSFGLGQRDWREEDSWFCSELITRALEVAGILTLPIDIPVWRLTPRDVWLISGGL